MEIIEIVSNSKRKIVISSVRDEELNVLTKRRYSFIWKTLKESAAIYKLQIDGEDDILGAMALVDFPNEFRIEIKLLASSKENVGKIKKYEGIAGCLIAFCCRESIKKYGYMACVSLIPKTELKHHYINKYGMIDAGWQLYLDGKGLHNIIKKYSL